MIETNNVSSLSFFWISLGLTLPDLSTGKTSTSNPNFFNSSIGSNTALCSIVDVIICFLLFLIPNSFSPRIAILLLSVAPDVKIISFLENYPSVDY